MAVFAANITDETVGLFDKTLATEEFKRFQRQTKLNLVDNTTLIRLALINLFDHLPSEKEVAQYKIALMRPSEFDDFLKTRLKEKTG